MSRLDYTTTRCFELAPVSFVAVGFDPADCDEVTREFRLEVEPLFAGRVIIEGQWYYNRGGNLDRD